MTILIGVDQGTSGTRAVAFDERLRPLGESYQPAHVSHPQPGWIEKDADETVATVERALGDLTAQLDGEVSAVGLDNEGETVVAWDAETLRPLAPAIVWGSRHSQSIVERLEAAGHGPRIQELSGLPLDPYFSATKIRWLVENDDAVASGRAGGPPARRNAGRLRLRAARRRRPHRAVHGRAHAAAGAGRARQLAPRAARAARHRPRLAAADRALGGAFGTLAGLPLRALLVDQTASLAGHGCLLPGMAKATYGTGIFLLQQAGAAPPAQTGGLLSVVAWELTEGRPSYALDGGVFSAGTVLTWLRDGLGAFQDPAESEAMATLGAGYRRRQVPARAGRDGRSLVACRRAGGGRRDHRLHDPRAHRPCRPRRALLPRARPRRRVAGAAGRAARRRRADRERLPRAAAGRRAGHAGRGGRDARDDRARRGRGRGRRSGPVHGRRPGGAGGGGTAVPAG